MMIRIEHVTKAFGRAVAVNDVTLNVAAGDSVALWGANGAGKTTLIRCALGLLSFQGTISVGGRDARRDGKAARMLIGYVPQELGFYDDLQVAEALRFFARLKGIHLRSAQSALGAVRLEGQERKRVRDLSGGMKQRLALAIALLGDPPVLVLDEVTASLDACGRKEFVQVLGRLSGSGRTILFASHRLEEISALAKRVSVMDRGRLVSDWATEDFIANMHRGVELRLAIDLESRQRAVDALREVGFEARLNDTGVHVPVPHSQKAAPFRVLAQARVAIEDFELEASQ